jgi:DnaJ-class molecular chaperone
LKGKGWPKKGGERGDQLVTLQVVVPANDAELERFVADWAGAEGNPRAALGV